MKFTKRLNTILLAGFVAVAGVAFAAAQATSWTVDKTHSSVNFQVTHFFTPVNGTFDNYNADVKFNPENLEESSINVDIMVNSINTKNEKRDNHLMSDDFFNAKKYPNMTFSSEKIESVGQNKFVAHGTLTIKDVSKNFALPFTLLGIQDNLIMEGKKVAGFVSEFTINRTEYDVGVGDWASDAVIGDEVKVNLNLEMNTDKKAG